MDRRTLENYIQEVDKARFRNPQNMLKISRRMRAEAKKDHDEKAKAYSEYFYLEACYRLGTLNEKMLSRAIHTLQICRRHQLYELEMKTNNMLGIFFLNQGDYVTSLEYYQLAMDGAVKHRSRGIIRIMTNNIGDLYMRIKQYDMALKYLDKCLEQSIALYNEQKKKGSADVQAINLNIALMNMAVCYYHLENYQESLSRIFSMYEVADGMGEAYYGAARDALIVQNYAKLGRLDEMEDYIIKTIQAAEAGKEKIETINDYMQICQILIEAGRIKQAERMFAAVGKIVNELNFYNLWCDYYETAILLAKKKQDADNLLECYENYFIAKKKLDEFQNRQQLIALKNRQALNLALKKQKKAEEDKVSLKCLSEHDSLTGLYNRYVLNRECEKWCRVAREKKDTVGVIIMDIDYFKQFNDLYGHLEGDRCIKEISEALREAVGNLGIIVRYGGDEFFVLLNGQKKETVVLIAKKINSCIRKRELRHEKSLVSKYATASQGIVNGIPEEGQSVLDLIHLADTALYKAKEVKRSSIGIYNKGVYEVIENETIVEE